MCTIWTHINRFRVSGLCYKFCGTYVIRLLDYSIEKMRFTPWWHFNMHHNTRFTACLGGVNFDDAWLAPSCFSFNPEEHRIFRFLMLRKL